MSGRLARSIVLERVADLVPGSDGSDCVRVGIDGVDGSGKTVFADELAEVLRDAGRPVVRVSVDDFHHVRAVRYRRGRDSPEGYWLDSYDYARLRADVLEPLAPGGSRWYRRAAHDVVRDLILNVEPVRAPPGAVLVLDGIFLHRRELAGTWDFSVFLVVPFDVTARRMAARDGTSADPNHASMRRYVEGQSLYLAACAPQQQASLVVDNTSFEAPRIIESGIAFT